MKRFFALLIIAAIVVGLIIAWPYIAPSEQNKAAAPSAGSGGIILSEVMTNNKGILVDDTGANSDWVEIYNNTDHAVDLSRFALSDNEQNPLKWVFPRMELAPHGYALVYLSGSSRSDLKNGIMHGSFKLSSMGEKLLLSDTSGHVVDSVDIPALPENVSYGRVNGQWQMLDAISPGYENSDAGAAAYQETRKVENPALRITELMAKSAMTIQDPQGEYSDWVEIANISDADYDLSGCGLTDDATKPMKWVFPAGVTIKPGETLLIFCSDRSSTTPDGALEAGFRLSSYSGVVMLSDRTGRLMDSVSYSDMPADWSYARGYSGGSPTDTWTLTSRPTPGYPNTEDGFAAFLAAHPAPASDIVISEALCSNSLVRFGEAQQSSDFIEIENRGSSAVNIGGYGLTDNAGNPAKFRFPDMTLGPGERVLVLAAGADAPADSQHLTAPFRLSRLGTTLALFDAEGKLLDRYFIGEGPPNISVGRAAGSTNIVYFSTPTPGAANGEGKAGIAPPVQFSQAPGKYDGAVQLTLTAGDGFDIYYTVKDGITPDENAPESNSTKYTGPITISSTASVRARAYRKGYIPSATSTATYFIGAQHALPVVAVTTDKPNLFDPATGIYTNSQKDVEVAASFELFDESGQRVFQQNIGLAMTGGLTLQMKEQKSLAIYARSKYGESTMAYPFFDNREYTEYKSLILRTAGREGGMVTKLNTYVALSLVDGQMHVLTQAAEPCVVYINGQYWGIYYLMEKRNKYMVAQAEGITDPAIIDTINLTKGLRDDLTSSGSYKGYAEIFEFVKTHDLSIQENYDWVDARLDTDSYMDFMINQIYIANNDTGNMQYYQVPPNGKWKQIYQDLDITFYSFDTLALRMDPNTAGSDIFNALLKNKGWRNRFIERFAWALKNIYNVDHVTAAIDEAAGLIRSEVEAEHKRWSSERPTLEEWEAGVQALKAFAKNRPAAVVNHLKQHFQLTQNQIDMLNDAIKN
ncbi:MAG: lamin tail domain-containing protein [Christensenellales bacterium]|jgi:hypothetical protein